MQATRSINRNFLMIFLFLLFCCNISAQFGEQQVISTEANGIRYVEPADLDGDGFLDVLSASSFDNKIAWYKNLDGTGNFGGQQVIGLLNQTIHLSTGDLDGDGDEDVVAVSFALDLVVWYENINGSGVFSSRQTISNTLQGAYYSEVVDVNGDGFLDVVASGSQFEEIYWYKNEDGLGNFSSAIVVALDSNVGREFVMKDLDGDGDLDAAMVSAQSETLSWVENVDGLGAFGSPIPLNSTFLANTHVLSEDLDGDGDYDLVTASPTMDEVAWYRNEDGQGNFSDKIIVNEGASEAYRLALTDVDNDGDMDVIVTYLFISELILWYENTDGLGSFGPPIEITTSVEGISTVAVADLDNDGDMDLLSSSQVDDKVAWYENLTILEAKEHPLELFSVYPNPSKTVLNIKIPRHAILTKVQCVDLMGQLLFETTHTSGIDICNLPSGVYFLKISLGNSNEMLRFVKE